MNNVTVVVADRTDLGDIVTSIAPAFRANNLPISHYLFSLAHWHLQLKFKELYPVKCRGAAIPFIAGLFNRVNYLNLTIFWEFCQPQPPAAVLCLGSLGLYFYLGCAAGER